MDPVLASNAQLLAIQSTLVNRALQDLSEEDLWRRPNEHSNSIGWLLGHVTWARNGMLITLTDQPVPMPWSGPFERGAQAADRSAYPATAEIVATLKTINEKLKAAMEVTTETRLSAPAPFATPSPDKTVRGVFAFLVFHEGYHIGQVGYILKLLGRPGLVG